MGTITWFCSRDLVCHDRAELELPRRECAPETAQILHLKALRSSFAELLFSCGEFCDFKEANPCLYETEKGPWESQNGLKGTEAVPRLRRLQLGWASLGDWGQKDCLETEFSRFSFDGVSFESPSVR